MCPSTPCSMASFMEVAQMVAFHAQVDSSVLMECDGVWSEKYCEAIQPIFGSTNVMIGRHCGMFSMEVGTWKMWKLMRRSFPCSAP